MALPPLPGANVSLFNSKTGLLDTLWYAWFKRFEAYLRGTDEYGTSIGDLEADKAGLAQVDCWCDYIVEVEDGDIVVIQKANFAGTITAVVTDCVSGTCTVTTKIEGVSIGTANSVSTTESEVTHSDAFAVGNTISYTISANSSCLGARVQINYSRNLAA